MRLVMADSLWSKSRRVIPVSATSTALWTARQRERMEQSVEWVQSRFRPEN